MCVCVCVCVCVWFWGPVPEAAPSLPMRREGGTNMKVKATLDGVQYTAILFREEDLKTLTGDNNATWEKIMDRQDPLKYKLMGVEVWDIDVKDGKIVRAAKGSVDELFPAAEMATPVKPDAPIW